MQPADLPAEGRPEGASPGEALDETFGRATGKRALVLLNSFPFLVIGCVREVAHGLLAIDVETTHLAELEGRLLWVRLDAVEAFHIEDAAHPIPVVRTGPEGT